MKSDVKSESKPVKNKLTKHLGKLAESDEERAELAELFVQIAGGLRTGLDKTDAQVRFTNALLIAAGAFASPEQLARKVQ